MMKNEKNLNVLYITSYYLKDVCEQRNPYRFISQAGVNKANFMMDVMKRSGCNVYVWSYAWADSRSFKFYKGFQSKENDHVYYSSIFGAPFLNVMSCVRSGKKFVDEFMKTNHIDLVVFYNMRVETSQLANYIKKKYHVPIVLEYEDGLEMDSNNSPYKRQIYRYMQKWIKPKLDGAILVNALVKKDFSCDSVVIRGAAKETDATLAPVAAGDKLKIMFSSTLDEQRGIQIVLEALKYTKTDFDLYVTGKGPLEDIVKQCEDPRLHFMGFLEDYNDYVKLLKQAHVCINAQKSAQEYGLVSFPSKLFEYLSNYKLVVSSDVADVEEVFGDTMLVYHNDDPKELAAMIDKADAMYRDENVLSEYQEKIHQSLRENSVEAIAEQFYKLANACIEKAKKD